MKNIRLVSLILTLVLTLASTGIAMSIPENKWYTEYVGYAYENNLVDYSDADSFDEKHAASTLDVIKSFAFLSDDREIADFPAYAVEKGFAVSTEEISNETPATRGFAAVVLSALITENESLNEIDFLPDISTMSENYNSILKLYNAGILAGKDSDGFYAPDSYITYEELSAIVSRIANKDFRLKISIPAGITVSDALKMSEDTLTDADKTEKIVFSTGYTISKAMYDYVKESSSPETTEEEIVNVLKTFAAAEKIMDNYKFALSGRAFNTLKAEFDSHWTAVKEIISSAEYNITEYAYITNYWTTVFFDQFYYEYLRNKIPSADVIYDAYSDAYVLAKHVLVSFKNGTEESKEAARGTANEVYKMATDGADFDELIAKYGEDPGMVYNPDGYLFTYGEMVEPFEKAAFALNDNEISKPVETNYGYHIIQRLPLTKEAFLSNSELYANLAMYHISLKFNNEFESIMEEITCR